MSWWASLAGAAAPEPERSCDEIDVTSVSSPDGDWMARSYGEVCDLGLSSSATVVVELVRAGSVNFRHVILGMTMPSAKTAWPKVAWESPNKVLVDLPSNAQTGIQVAFFQGIEVNVRFCPRDPAVRASWLEYRVAYRQWLADTTAWIEAKKRDRASALSQPLRPTAPSTGMTSACSE
jgi:hypothetical protein